MAKSLISSILKQQLGNYIDGLEEDSLQVGLWNGEVILNDLKLHSNAFQEFDLPISIAYGEVQSVHVKVPWNALGSQSLEISLQGISVVAEPHTELPTPQQIFDIKKRLIERMELLRQHAKLMENSSSREEETSGFFKRLASRILDNLKLNISDVRIRYEDRLSHAQHPFSIGIALDALTYATTDANGNQVFVDRSLYPTAFVHKIIQVKNLAIYCDRLKPDATSAEDKRIHFSALDMKATPQAIKKTLMKIVNEKHDFILQPMSIQVRLIKNESLDFTIHPQWKCSLELKLVALTLHSEQYTDILHMHRAFTNRSIIARHFVQKATPIYPVHEDPWIWWRYAAKSCYSQGPRTKRTRLSRIRWSSIHRSTIDRRKYKSYFKVWLAQQEESADVENERKFPFLEEFEQRYPVEVIMRLRSSAQEEYSHEQAQSNLERTTKSSWYSYFFGSDDDEEESHLISQEGRQDVNQACTETRNFDEAAIPDSCSMYRFEATLEEGSLVLVQNRTPLTRIVSAGEITCDVYPKASELHFALNEFRIDDLRLCTSELKLFSGIICTTGSSSMADNGNDPCVKLSIASNMLDAASSSTTAAASHRLEASVLPFIVVVDLGWCCAMQQYFQTPEAVAVWTTATSSLQGWVEENQKVILDAIVQHQTNWDFFIDIDAPVFLLPEGSQPLKTSSASALEHVLVMDLGHLRCSNEKKDGKWMIDLKQIQLLLTNSTGLDCSRGSIRREARKTQIVIDHQFSVPIVREFDILMVLDQEKTENITKFSVNAKLPQFEVTLSEKDIHILGLLHYSFLKEYESLQWLERQVHLEDLEPNENEAKSPASPGTSSDVTLDKVLSITFDIEEAIYRVSSFSKGPIDILELTMHHNRYMLEYSADRLWFHAELESFEAKDQHHAESSPFHMLASSSNGNHFAEDGGEAEQTLQHLIVVDVEAADKNARAAADIVATFEFHVLKVQWNPTTVGVLNRVFEGYFKCWDTEQGQSRIWITSPESSPSKPVAPAFQTESCSRPRWMLNARITELSIRFNKDEANRSLALVSILNTNIQMSEDHTGQLVTGTLENVILRSLSNPTTKYPLLLERSVDPDLEMPPNGTNSPSLIRFTYVMKHQQVQHFNFELANIRLVYLQNEVMEIIDYFYEGILGILISHAMAVAASSASPVKSPLALNQLGMESMEPSSYVQFHILIPNPRVSIPRSSQSLEGITLQAERLEMSHDPMIHISVDKDINIDQVARDTESSGGITIVEADHKVFDLKGLTLVSHLGRAIVETPVEIQLQIYDVFVNDLYAPRFEPGPEHETLVARYTVDINVLTHQITFVTSKTQYELCYFILMENILAPPIVLDKLPDLCAPSSNSRPSIQYTYAAPVEESDRMSMRVDFVVSALEWRLLSDEDEAQGLIRFQGKDLAMQFWISSYFFLNTKLQSLEVHDLKNLNAVESSPQLHPDYACFFRSKQPLTFAYEYRETLEQKLSTVDVNVDEVYGIFLPEAVTSLLTYFTIPASSQSFVVPVPSSGETSSGSKSSTSEMHEEVSIPQSFDFQLHARSLCLHFLTNLCNKSQPFIRCEMDLELTQAFTTAAQEGDILDQQHLKFLGSKMQLTLGNPTGTTTPSFSSAFDACDPKFAHFQLVEPCCMKLDYQSIMQRKNQTLQEIVGVEFAEPIQVFLSAYDFIVLEQAMKLLEQFQPQEASSAHPDKSEFIDPLTSGTVTCTEGAPSTQVVNVLHHHRYVQCQIEHIQLSLIYDFDGCEMNLLEIHVIPSNLFWNQNNDTKYAGNGTFTIEAFYYSPTTRKFEQLLDEWRLEISFQQLNEEQKQKHHFQVVWTAQEHLRMTMSKDLLQTFGSLLNAYDFHQAIAPSDLLRPCGPLVLCNELGIEVEFCISLVQQQEQRVIQTSRLRPDEAVAITSPKVYRRGNGVIRQAPLKVRLNLKWLHPDFDDFQEIMNVDLTLLGMRLHPLVYTSGGLSKYAVVLETKIERGKVKLTISSNIAIQNHTNHSLNCCLHDPSWEAPIRLQPLKPFSSRYIPLKSVIASELRIERPEDGKWSSPMLLHGHEHHQSDGTGQIVVASPPSALIFPSIFNVQWRTQDFALQRIGISSPLQLKNMLPVSLYYRLRDPRSSRIQHDPTQEISSGMTDDVFACQELHLHQYPHISFRIQGCQWSKWVPLDYLWKQLQHKAQKETSLQHVECVVKTPLQYEERRADEDDVVNILLRSEYMKNTMHPSTLRLAFFSECWIINRTGLHFQYQTSAFIPSSGHSSSVSDQHARAFTTMGNAHISLGSLSSRDSQSIGGSDSDTISSIRLRIPGSVWSPKFQPDPRKLDWHRECLRLRSCHQPTSTHDPKRYILHEFGISADYATHLHGTLTCFLSIIPRYLILNQTDHIIVLREQSSESIQAASALSECHVLYPNDANGYALCWLKGKPSRLQAAQLRVESYSSQQLAILLQSEDCWSKPFEIVNVEDGRTGTAWIPEGTSGQWIDVTIKRGSLAEASFLISLSLTTDALTTPIQQQLVPTGRSSTWQLSFQFAGISITCSDVVDNIASSASSLFGQSFQNHLELQHVACLTLETIRFEFQFESLSSGVKIHSTKHLQLIMEKVLLKDLRPSANHQMVVIPDRTRAPSRKADYFFGLTFKQKSHSKFIWIEQLSMEVQPLRIRTTLPFIVRLSLILNDLFDAMSPPGQEHAATAEGQLLANSMPANASTFHSTTTSTKMYIESFEIQPIFFSISFKNRDPRQSKEALILPSSMHTISFWVEHLKLELDNVSFILDKSAFSEVFLSREALIDALVRSYTENLMSQALNCVDVVQVTNIVASLVTESVSTLYSNMVDGLRSGLQPLGIVAAKSSSSFKAESLSNRKILLKHSKAFTNITTRDLFQSQVNHLVFDWDTNHSGLSARKCIAVAIINQSKHPLHIRVVLERGAEVHCLPLDSADSTARFIAGKAAVDRTGRWNVNQSLVVFAFGYGPALASTDDISFELHSNGFDAYFSCHRSRLRENSGFTASFLNQCVETWHAKHTIMIAEDLNVMRETRVDPQLSAHEYEVVFHDERLGLTATTSSERERVFVGAYRPPHSTCASDRISVGDQIVAIQGIQITQVQQVGDLVRQTRRPITIRFRAIPQREEAEYDLFGAAESAKSAVDEEYNLFG